MNTSKYFYFTKPFCELSIYEVHDIFAIRSEVFVVEQNCVYQDIDGKDLDALHIFIKDVKDRIIAYTRIFDQDKYHENYLSIGRVVVAPNRRKIGLGQLVMKYSIEQCHKHFGKKPIKISAQAYLDEFYTNLGFEATGKNYLEDGIPHMEMILK